MMLLSAGTFLEATTETSYFQIGESKYGKPVLDRVSRPETSARHKAPRKITAPSERLI